MSLDRTIYCIYFILSFVLISCEGNKPVYPPANVAPLAETAIKASRMPLDEAADFVESNLKGYENEYEAMLKVTGLIDADNPAKEWIASAPITVFAPAVATSGIRTEDIASQLGSILGNAKALGLDINQKGYATAIWGKPQSIIFCDSIMLIGLNHYLGENYEGYSSFEAYRRAVKKPEMIPYDIAEALVATKYPYEAPDNQKVINRLVYEGILTEAKMRLVPDANLADALGYDEQQLQWLEEHEGQIWEKLVSTKTIFDSSETTADRLVLPTPSCPIISAETPGRAGRFIGYKIVESYLKANKDASLSDLLKGDFYKSSNPLISAEYTANR